MIWKKAFLAFAGLVLFATAARADSAPIDEVTFTAVFTSVSGATETISGNFEWSQSPIDGGLIFGTTAVSASGFLGTFTGPGQPNASYIDYIGQFGDEIDLYLNGDLSQYEFALFDCFSVQCFEAYPTDAGFAGKPPTSSTLTVTPLGMPEPASLSMLFAGLLGLFAISKHRNRSRRSVGI